MGSPCKNHHLFLRSLPEGCAVHPVGRLPERGEWLLDPRLLDHVAHTRPGCLYVDCSQVEYCGAVWFSHMLRLFKAVREREGKLVLCGIRPTLGEIMAITLLDKVVGVQTQEAPGGRLQLPEQSWLTWNDGTVVRLARAIRAKQAYEQLPVLADALEEAGCGDADILGHCRSGGQHVPHCWVVGLLAVEA
jgi:anti-anti-sigma factor